jgi:uncharacterized protein (DUF2141 family)
LEATIMRALGKDAAHHPTRPSSLICALVLIGIGFAVQSPSDGLAGEPQEAKEVRSGELVIVISGLETDQGLLNVALMNSAETFESDSDAFRDDSVAVNDGQATVVFSDLPFGSYAAKIYHDENSNGELDTSFVGFPKEAFGFSNDAMGRFGPPSFEQAKFEFASKQQRIEIHAK